MSFESVIERMRVLGRENPDARAFTFVDERGRTEATLSRGELVARVDAIAHQLVHRWGLRPGDRAILVYPPGLDFVQALVGCLVAGVLPVPVYPPDPLNLGRDVERFRRVVQDCGAAVVLTNRRYAGARMLGSARTLFRRDAAGWPEHLTWHVTTGLGTRVRRALGVGRSEPDRVVTPATPAFLQYTSGSTAAPKGVVITHGNVVHQLEFNRRMLGMGPDARFVSWVPPYHDFGLISGILSSTAGNGHLTMCSPLAFIRRPALWFELMHRMRATHTAAPNFAYELAVRKTTPEQRAGWDLSALQVAMSAAEPVREETTGRFLDAFAVSGLRPEAFCPAYGLAEHTVGVTVAGRARLRLDREALERHQRVEPAGADAELTLMGCGPITDGIDVRIVDPESRRELPPGAVGEIWVDSPSKAAGYWGLADLSQRTFHARLAGDESSRGYLRTGDLGVLHDGELFVCGRIKDLIILAGRNMHPQDIEESLRDCHPAIRPGGIAAFAIDRAGEEALAVLVETRTGALASLPEVVEAVRATVLAEHRIACAVVVLGPPGAVSKTTSGKVQRSRCRQRLLDGSLERDALLVSRFDDEVAASASRALAAAMEGDALPAPEGEVGVVYTALRSVVAEVLGVPPSRVDPTAPMAAQGLSSRMAVDLASRLGDALGRDVPINLLFDHPTIEALAEVLTREAFGGNDGERSPAVGRVAVIGGGVAGVAAAARLVDMGAAEVVLYEAGDRVGGKVYTEPGAGDDKPYEFGQIILTARYVRSLKLAARHGLRVEAKRLHYRLLGEDGAVKPLETDERMLHAMEWTAEVMAAAGLEAQVHAMDLVDRDDLSGTAHDWLAEKGLLPVPLPWLQWWTGFGYGELTDDIPAVYFLSYASLIHEGGAHLSLVDGNDQIWRHEMERIEGTGRARAVLNCRVQAIGRRSAGVEVLTEAGEAQTFDRVVVACHPDQAARLLPAHDPRQPLLSRFTIDGYTTAIFDAEGLEEEGGYYLEETLGRAGLKPLQFARVGAGRFLTSQYFDPDTTDAALDRALAEMVTRFGGRFDGTLERRRWRFFPRLSCADYAAGTLQQLDALQGQDGIVLVGGYLAHEMVEHAVGHAQDTVSRCFAEPVVQQQEPIAIVGIGCRYPGGVDSPTRFWDLLAAGRDAITEVPAERWDVDAWYDPDPNAPGRMVTRFGGFVPDVDRFEPGFFGISPSEAVSIDPQQRLLLECCWEAVERAGIAPPSLMGSQTGVFMGLSANEYQMLGLTEPMAIEAASLTGSAASTSVGRISYVLGLEGPNMPIDTACSSSLVAVHLACESLGRGECDMALAGGANLVLTPHVTIALSRAGALSPTGRCHSFGAGADGYVRSDGCGVLALRRLSDAQRRGEPILAVIRGSAINQDGRSQGLTAPRGGAQRQVIERALGRAGVAADQVDYVECHGSGTDLGDPIEVRALAEVFGERDPGAPLAIGSVKSNIGHAESAAGVAGLIKAVLCLQREHIAPSLHADALNPRVPWSEIPVEVARQTRPWPRGERVRHAGVSSFGFSGTNAHLVVSEAPARASEPTAKGLHLVPLSASSDTALERMTARLVDDLHDHPDRPLADVAHTLQRGRVGMACRRFVVGRDADDVLDALERRDPARVRTGLVQGEAPRLAFMLSGVGDQYPGMTRGLYASEPVFRAAVDRCCALLVPHLGLDLRTLILPAEEAAPRPASGGFDLRRMLGRDQTPQSPAERALQQTIHAQPAVFVIDYALACLWRSLGVHPDILIGHSIGEWVAAHLAGVIELEDALELVALRARLVEDAPSGAMLAVNLSAERLEPLLEPGIELTAYNAPELCAVGGTAEAIEAFAARLQAEQIPSRRMAARHAFHSSALKEAAAALRTHLDAVTLRPPTIPFVSNTTGALIEANQATSADYWAQHLCSPVRFGPGLSALAGDEDVVLLEVGPGRALASFARQQLRGRPAGRATVLASTGTRYDRRPDEAHLLDTIGQLWLAGRPMPARDLYQGERRLAVALPTYPFERTRHWIEAAFDGAGPAKTVEPVAPERIADPDGWYLAPTWARTAAVDTAWLDEIVGQTALVFVDAGDVGLAVAESLRARGVHVVTVARGAGARFDEAHAEIDPREPDHYAALLRTVAARGGSTRLAVHLWALDAAPGDGHAALDGDLDRGFFSLMHLAQALGGATMGEPTRLVAVTTGAFDVLGGEAHRPVAATAQGIVQVLPAEVRSVAAAQLDLDARTDAQAAASAVLAECDGALDAPAVARRGRHRWVQRHERVTLPARALRDPVPYRRGGVYLVTGGLGGIGLAVAEKLARDHAARLVLVGRTALPAREDWPAHLEGADADGRVAEKLRAIQRLEALGAEVLPVSADIAQPAAARTAVEQARARFGHIDGVVHAAGVAGAGLLALKDRDTARAVLAPKVHGTLALAAALRDAPPELFVLFGSMFSFASGVGQSDYTAANAFMDAFAVAEAEAGRLPAVCIAWGLWKWNAWNDAPETAIERRFEALRQRTGLEFDEGMVALDRCLSAGHPQIAVSPVSVATLRRLAGEPDPGPTVRHARPDHGTPYVAPRTAVEATLADIWQDVLALERVGVHDDFLELGGNSLLGVQIINRVRATFAAEISMQRMFESSTIAALAPLVDPEAPERADAAHGVPESVEPAADVDGSPLSLAQQRLWAIARMYPQIPCYNVVAGMRITGVFDPARFERALDEVVAGHEILRARFEDRAGQPVMHIAAPEDAAIRVEHLDLRVDSDADAAWRRRVQTLTRTPFDLRRAPLLRPLVARVGDAEWVVACVYHHLIADLLSTVLMFEVVMRAYGAPGAPGEAFAYRSFVRRQLAAVDGPRAAAARRYWLQRFAKPPAPLVVPADFPRPAVQSGLGDAMHRTVPQSLVADLERLARAEDATLYATMMAAFLVLLRTASGTGDLVVGTPITLRDRPELEGLLGPVFETAAVRTDVGDDPPFRALIGRVRDALAEAYDHRDMPFDELVRAVGGPRDLSRSPLFQVMFALQELPPAVEQHGARFDFEELARGASAVDFSLFVRRGRDRCHAQIEYATDLFDRPRMERMLGHYLRILECVVAEPERPVSQLDWLTPAQREALLSGLTRPGGPRPEADRSATPTVDPDSPTGRVLTGIWRDVLEVDEVNTDSNFFHLGGDSLMAIRASAKARAEGLPVSPALMVRHPTLGALLAALEPSAPAIDPIPGDPGEHGAETPVRKDPTT